MHVLHALPAVLRIVTEADDDLAALVGLCGWARSAGADACLLLGVGGQRLLAADHRRSEGPTACESEVADRVAERETVDQCGVYSVAAAIRYAGVKIGAVVVRGDRQRHETLHEMAATLAAVCAPAVRSRLDALGAGDHGPTRLPEILGISPAIRLVRDAIVRASTMPFPVLIEGESGTGKELVARAVHRLSARRDRRFAAINCAALADELVDAELFGHARGAFTGAVGPRTGLFEDAHGGSLFLDEVAELSLRAQAKLLRAIQEREVRRLGENVSRAVDARLIAATNRRLSQMVATGQFREDLLFRLAVVRLQLPPLRDRMEDVPLLVHAHWDRLSREAGKRAWIGPDALARLGAHEWPGNVRELQNVMAALVVLAPARGRIGSRHVEQVLSDSAPLVSGSPMSLERARTSCERRTIAAALARHGGRRMAAARELGLSRQGLTKAMRRLHLASRAAREGVA